MQIEKLSSLKCIKCGSIKVFKTKKAIICKECNKKYYDNGVVEKLYKYPGSKGCDPRYDTGDYLEG